jgi:hypothetical protein
VAAKTADSCGRFRRVIDVVYGKATERYDGGEFKAPQWKFQDQTT